MCHAAMSQNKIERGCSVVASRKSRSTRPHSRVLPRDMRLDENHVRDQRAKSAERGEKTQLPDLFAQIRGRAARV